MSLIPLYLPILPLSWSVTVRIVRIPRKTVGGFVYLFASCWVGRSDIHMESVLWKRVQLAGSMQPMDKKLPGTINSKLSSPFFLSEGRGRKGGRCTVLLKLYLGYSVGQVVGIWAIWDYLGEEMGKG